MKVIRRSSPFGSLTIIVLAFLAITASLRPVALADSPRGQRGRGGQETLPGAPQILPADTMAYLRLDNVDDIRREWSDTSLGRMMQDPALRPMISDTYKLLADMVDQASGAIGVSLDEVLSIPHGQFAIAVLPRSMDELAADELDGDRDNVKNRDQSDEAIKRRLRQKRKRNHSFSFVMIIDAGDNIQVLRDALEHQEKRVGDGNRFVVRRSRIDDVELTRFIPSRPGRQPLESFEVGSTMVIGIGEKTASGVLEQWLGRSNEPTLAEHGRFVSLMSRCIGEENTRPQATFYLDPAAIVERLMRRNLTASMVIPIVDQLGLRRLGRDRRQFVSRW